MKNKIVTIILGVALVVSLCGNGILFKMLADTREELEVMSNQIADANNQISDLQKQLGDFEKVQLQVEELQTRLTEKDEIIKGLEESLAESNTQIQNLESTIEENNATIESLEEELAAAVARRNAQQASQGSSGNSGQQSTVQRNNGFVFPEGTVGPGALSNGGQATAEGDGSLAGAPKLQ